MNLPGLKGFLYIEPNFVASLEFLEGMRCGVSHVWAESLYYATLCISLGWGQVLVVRGDMQFFFERFLNTFASALIK